MLVFVIEYILKIGLYLKRILGMILMIVICTVGLVGILLPLVHGLATSPLFFLIYIPVVLLLPVIAKGFDKLADVGVWFFS